jgi:hypothetical protein
MHKESKFVSAMLHTSIAIKQDFKTCSICGETRRIDEFNKNPRAKDGKRAECTYCREDYAKPRRRSKKQDADWYKQFMPI